MGRARRDDLAGLLRRIAENRAARIALVVGIVALIGWRSWWIGTHWRLQDFTAYRRGSWGLFHLGDPYSARAEGGFMPFIYPTFAALVLAPVTLLPLTVGQTVMTALTLGCMVAVTWLALGQVIGRGHPLLPWWTAVVALLGMLSEPYKMTIALGQVNAVLLALVMFDVLALRDRRWAGVLVGVATGMKLTPAIFIVYLLVRREWVAARNACAVAVATALCGLVAAPGPTWRYFIGGDFLFSLTEVGKSSNQSILGGLTRLTHDEATARPFWYVAVVVMLVVGWRTIPRIVDRMGELAGLSAVAILALLIAPTSWTHYWIWWPIVEVVLVGIAWRTRSFAATVAAASWPIPFYFGVQWFEPYPELPDYQHGLVASLLDRSYVLAGVALLAGMAVATRVADEALDHSADAAPGGVSGGGN